MLTLRLGGQVHLLAMIAVGLLKGCFWGSLKLLSLGGSVVWVLKRRGEREKGS